MNSSTTSVKPLQQNTVQELCALWDREVSVLHRGLIYDFLQAYSDLQDGVEHDSHLPQHLLRKSQTPRARAKRLLVKVCPKGLIAQPMAAGASGWVGFSQVQSHSQKNFSTAVTVAKDPKFNRRNHRYTQNTHSSSLEGSTSHDYQGDSTFSTCSTTFSEDSIKKHKEILGLRFIWNKPKVTTHCISIWMSKVLWFTYYSWGK